MEKVELVFIPAPAVGHLVSIHEFAKLLIDRNDNVSVTIIAIKPPLPSPSTDSYTKSIAASQTRIKLVHIPQVDPPPQELLKSPVTYFSLYIESHLHLVKAIVNDILSTGRVAGLVVDFFCVSMIDVAHDLSLPSYLFVSSNAGSMALMLHLSTPQNQITPGIKFSDPDLQIPGISKPVPPSVLPSSLTDGSYERYVKFGKKFRETKGIIVNTFAELEPFALDSFLHSQTYIPPVYPVGPAIDLEGGQQAYMCSDPVQRQSIINWLDGQPQSSVVLLCFGSMGSFDSTQVKEIALGLDRSGNRFLWSLRKSSPVPEEEEEEDIFPEGFLERVKGRGMVCGWVPQVEILAHKAVGGFVSHCGWNSVLESLWHGVPIATWPLYAEQQLNAFRMVRELGLAEELRLDYRRGGGTGLVTAEEIERAVKLVMENDSEVRKKVKEMGEVARNVVLDGGSSFVSIGRLIEDFMG